MTFVAAIYPEAAHFQNETGAWEDIDNTVVETKDEKGRPVLTNRRNSYQVFISPEADVERLVTMQLGKHSIAWGLQGAAKSKGKIVPAPAADNLPANERATALTKK